MDRISNVYLLKDLARLSGQSIYTIKFYLKLGLVQESGRSPQTRFRYFDDGTLAQLARIRAWRKQKKSLAEIAALLKSDERSRLKVQGSREALDTLFPSTLNLEPPTVSG